MVKEECIFCKLANGVIPTYSIYEDEEFKVILDANPATYGHALVLPKQHWDNVYSMDPQLQGKAYQLAARLAVKAKERFGCDGVNILQNNEEAAGQTVFHFHMHIIPRYKKDGVGIGWNPQTVEKKTFEEIVEKMK